MIVRAKTKALDQLPPEILCCEPTIALVKKGIGKEFRVDTSIGGNIEMSCPHCGRRLVMHMVLNVDTGGWRSLETTDLDEGYAQ